MPAEIPKFSNAHFKNIPENLSHIFDANLTDFLPEWKSYVSIEKIMEKLSEFLAEIPSGDRALMLAGCQILWKKAGPNHQRIADTDYCQRWSRGHKARGQGQGHKKIRGQGQPALQRTDRLEAKDRNVRGQGPRTQAQALFKKKRSSDKIFRQSQKKTVFQKIFQPLRKLLTTLKIELSSSRGQTNFRGLEASRPRTSNCVLEAKDVLEDSTSVYYAISLDKLRISVRH